MKKYRIALIPGDGIGPEVIAEGVKVIDKASELNNFEIDWVKYDNGADNYLKTGELITEETLKEIKKLGLFTETLILTGHGSIDSALEAIKIGAYDYLTKPCEIDELVAKIEGAWEKKDDKEKKDIEEVMADLKKHGIRYKDVDRTAKKGDRVEVNFSGFDNDEKPIPNTKSQNHPVVLGENSLIPGFEDEIIGLKKGDKKEFDITFPKDYGKKEFQGRKVKFKIELLRVEEGTEPEINEEFIEKMTGKKQSVKDFEEEIGKNIKARKETETERDRENKYVEELLKKVKVEVPETASDEMEVVARVTFPWAAKAPVVVAELNVGVEGLVPPIGVLLMVPPLKVAPAELKVLAVNNPLIVVVESVAAP